MNRLSLMLAVVLCASASSCDTGTGTGAGTGAGTGTAARWISHPEAAAADAGKQPIALQFRREVVLAQEPAVFRVRVSADNRFILYVNERRVGAGPARGDLKHWRYETLDLAPYLRSGANVIAAQVWNDAGPAPMAQVSSGRTGFWLSAEEASHADLIDTGAEWKVRLDRSRSVEAGRPALQKLLGGGFYAAGPQETFDGALLQPDWASPTSRATDWQSAALLNDAESGAWTLVADSLPQMRRDRVASGRTVRASGVAPGDFPERPVTVPANSEASILIDAGRVLAAYPALVVSGGRGARVTVAYVEALYDPQARTVDINAPTRTRFTDRAAVKDGLALGITDTFKPDGAAQRRYEPFWWRVWRFAEIKVTTGAEPLTLHDFETWETGYPFIERGRFVSNDTELNAIWRTGWMTGLVDAHETYMDSAYWEQLQYIGDTRIQMLISYAVSGDARLAVQALDASEHSRVVAGLPLTRSQWPSVLNQVIPPFSLLWIGSLHDYWMHQPDTAVILRNLPGTRSVLDEFARYVQPTGLVGPIPGWPFVDWRPGLDGWADREKGMLSCIITMQYFGALREAADLERALGDAARSTNYLQLADNVRKGLSSECWDAKRGLYADTPAKTTFSQHGAVLAVLYDIAPADQHRTLLEKVMVPGGGIDAPVGITPTSYYFSFYLARALVHAGMADQYLEMLKPWRAMLQQGFTTWPETPDPTRSDTHAWAGHPTTGLLTYVAGINPDAPGFARVRIEPHLGLLTTLDAALAHPSGLIETRYELQPGRLSAVITLPNGVSGTFSWKGQTSPLNPEKNEITLVEGTREKGS